jgi:hypothetical protein
MAKSTDAPTNQWQGRRSNRPLLQARLKPDTILELDHFARLNHADSRAEAIRMLLLLTRHGFAAEIVLQVNQLCNQISLMAATMRTAYTPGLTTLMKIDAAAKQISALMLPRLCSQATNAAGCIRSG